MSLINPSAAFNLHYFECLLSRNSYQFFFLKGHDDYYYHLDAPFYVCVDQRITNTAWNDSFPSQSINRAEWSSNCGFVYVQESKSATNSKAEDCRLNYDELSQREEVTVTVEDDKNSSKANSAVTHVVILDCGGITTVDSMGIEAIAEVVIQSLYLAKIC